MSDGDYRRAVLEVIHDTTHEIINQTLNGTHHDDVHHEEEHGDSEHHGSTGVAVLVCAILYLTAGTILRTFQTRYEFPVPYTVLILGFGFAWGIIYQNPLWSTETQVDIVGTTVISNLDPHMFLILFIPPLIFESAFSVNFHTFERVFGQGLVLAGPGVLVASVLSGLVSMVLFKFNFAQGLLFGAIVSATDPVAVVALLRDVGASKKLATLIEAESLLNDGTAYVLWAQVLTFVIGEGGGIWELLWQFIRMAPIGLLYGWFCGYICGCFLYIVDGDFIIETSFTFVGCWLTFWTAQMWELCEILAVVSFGLYLSKNRVLISPAAEHSLHHVWEFLSYVANTLIFFITGVILSTTMQESWAEIFYEVLLNVVLYVSLHLIRFLVLFASFPIMKRMGYGFTVDDLYVLVFGALRGAIGLGMGLLTVQALQDHPELHEVSHRMLLHCAFIVLWTLALNASFMPTLVSYLQIDRLTEESQVIFQQVCQRLKHEETILLKSMKDDPLYAATQWNIMNKAMPDYDKLKKKCFRGGHGKRNYSVDMKTSLRRMVNSFATEPEFSRNSDSKNGRKSIFHTHRERKKSKQNDNTNERRYSRDLAEAINLCDNVSLSDEIRHRVLATVKASYWHHFHEGMISEEATKLLVESAEIAMDRKDLNAQWDYIAKYTEVPWWLSWLYQKDIPILRNIVNMLLVNKLQIGIQLCESFVLSFTKVANMFEAFPEFADLKMAQRIIAEGAELEKSAKKCRLSIKVRYSDIYRSVKTWQASRFVLNKKLKIIESLKSAGVMEDKEYMRLKSFIQKQFRVALHARGKVQLSEKGDLALAIFKEASWLDHLGEDLLEELFKECLQETYSKGDYIFKTGHEVDHFYIIVSGMAELRSGGEIFEYRESSQVLGIISLLSKKQAHCDAIAFTDTSIIKVPSIVCKQMFEDDDTRDALCKLTADILLERYFQDVFKQLTTVEMNQKVQRGHVAHVVDGTKKMIFSREAILLRGVAIPVKEGISDDHDEDSDDGFICAPTVILPSDKMYTFTVGSIFAELGEVEDMVNAFNAIEVLENTEELTSHKQHHLKKKRAPSSYNNDEGLNVQEYSLEEEDTVKKKHSHQVDLTHNNGEDDESDEDGDEQDTFIMDRQNTMCALKMMAKHENAMLEPMAKKSYSYPKHSFKFADTKKSLSQMASQRKPSGLQYGKSIVQSNKFKTLYIPTHARGGRQLSISDSSECSDHMLQNNFFQANELSNQNQALSLDAVAHLKLKSMKMGKKKSKKLGKKSGLLKSPRVKKSMAYKLKTLTFGDSMGDQDDNNDDEF